MAEAKRPSSQSYFYGRISREEAEKFLIERGKREGLYLLRESMTTAGNYALSICHKQNIHHYSIERQPDGSVMIQDGKKFPGPVELVNHHSQVLDGFLTKPTIPCHRSAEVPPMAWPGVTYKELEEILLEKAQKLNLKDSKLENVLGPQRSYYVSCVAKELHTEQPWFHGRIERDAADKTMKESQHFDGKFLVRERDDKSYALSLSFNVETKHYKIAVHKVANDLVKLAIEDGPRFDNLMDMIAHYHNKTDGLLCKLTTPCVKKGWKKKSRVPGQFVNVSPAYGILPGYLLEARFDDEPSEIDDGPVSSRGPNPVTADDDSQKVYDSVPRTEDVFNLNRQDLELLDELGGGNFGSVKKGVYTRTDRVNPIPVAVKTLKSDGMQNAQAELMKEARMMAELAHRNIVRLIGVCRAKEIMLVMELAPLGQLNKYLKRHKDLNIKKVLELMFQVAQGMQYLESKNFVHRDLAARNVLLVNENFAKISDFGMSRALGFGSQYYRAESAGKWPLKWYAPECIYYWKFDSKSDVWSYGVTLWEATSYGEKPYRGLRGQQILELIDQNKRLEKPNLCPPGVYDVMMQCWRYAKDARPTFAEIVTSLRKYRLFPPTYANNTTEL